jgi:alkanesulfonate monooxygenase SsuD/methylene tetrahydromethanopterin reductase-like flavin-dependent oxidoreductase (luciferase family)
MVPIAVGRTPAEAQARAEKAYAIMPRLPQGEPAWREAGFLHGTPADVIPTLRRWEALGVGRVMLQLLDQDDLAAIDLIAREVLPAFRPS